MSLIQDFYIQMKQNNITIEDLNTFELKNKNNKIKEFNKKLKKKNDKIKELNKELKKRDDQIKELNDQKMLALMIELNEKNNTIEKLQKKVDACKNHKLKVNMFNTILDYNTSKDQCKKHKRNRFAHLTHNDLKSLQK